MENRKVSEWLSGAAGRISGEVHIGAMRSAFSAAGPLFLTAGLMVFLRHRVFSRLLTGAVQEVAFEWTGTLLQGMLGISALVIAALTGYYLAKGRGVEQGIPCALVSAAGYVIMIPPQVMGTGDFGRYTGTESILAAVLIGMVCAALFLRADASKYLKICLGEAIPSAVGESLSSLVPYVLVFSAAGLLSAGLNLGMGTDLIRIITDLVQRPFGGAVTSLTGCMILYALGNSLWLLGIHHAAIYCVLLEPFLIIHMLQDMAAYAAGQEMPHVINVAMVQAFGMLGGSGSTLCLILAAYLAGKKAETRETAGMALVPGIFNINEPVIFGFPIVGSRQLIVPFVLVPTIGIAVAYGAAVLGYMDPCVVYVPWTVPPLLSGFLVTGGDIRGALVQLVILAAGVVIYLPFLRLHDRSCSA